MKRQNQEFYWAVVSDREAQHPNDLVKGTFIGGPQGVSQAPHLYFTPGKAGMRLYPGCKVVKVRLEIVE